MYARSHSNMRSLEILGWMILFVTSASFIRHHMILKYKPEVNNGTSIYDQALKITSTFGRKSKTYPKYPLTFGLGLKSGRDKAKRTINIEDYYDFSAVQGQSVTTSPDMKTHICKAIQLSERSAPLKHVAEHYDRIKSQFCSNDPIGPNVKITKPIFEDPNISKKQLFMTCITLTEFDLYRCLVYVGIEVEELLEILGMSSSPKIV